MLDMKNKLSIALTFFLLAVLAACKKEISKIYYEGGIDPVLTASATNVSLEPGQEANTALVLNWTNPNYKFTTGISSQDVSYVFEFDTAGGNFKSGKKVVYNKLPANSLSKTFTVADLNSVLGNDMQLQLNPRRNYTINVRVGSSINSSLPLFSNAISFTTKPFAPPPKVEPPTNGTLWATGDAFLSGYANPLNSPYDVSQKFTKVSNTLYEAIVDMKGGGGYKLIQIQGDWSTQYHALATGRSWDAGEFEKKDAEPGFPGPPSAGKYKITVDFQLGKYTVVKQ